MPISSIPDMPSKLDIDDESIFSVSILVPCGLDRT